MWKAINILAYVVAIGLFAYGIWRYAVNETAGANPPVFFIILALFLVLFIFGAKRSRKFHDHDHHDSDHHH